MQDIHDIANFLIYLAQSGEEPDPLTHLRLQKLLYYVQGWSIALRKTPAFSDRIEAWAHGPVVPSLYHEIKDVGNRPLLLETAEGELPFQLDDDDKAFISEVWDTYKAYSASKLREMTHREDPWVNARKGLDPAERCNNEITLEAMASFFGKLSA